MCMNFANDRHTQTCIVHTIIICPQIYPHNIASLNLVPAISVLDFLVMVRSIYLVNIVSSNCTNKIVSYNTICHYSTDATSYLVHSYMYMYFSTLCYNCVVVVLSTLLVYRLLTDIHVSYMCSMVTFDNTFPLRTTFVLHTNSVYCC